jgi:hypothetical protein
LQRFDFSYIFFIDHFAEFSLTPYSSLFPPLPPLPPIDLTNNKIKEKKMDNFKSKWGKWGE